MHLVRTGNRSGATWRRPESAALAAGRRRIRLFPPFAVPEAVCNAAGRLRD